MRKMAAGKDPANCVVFALAPFSVFRGLIWTSRNTAATLPFSVGQPQLMAAP